MLKSVYIILILLAVVAVFNSFISDNLELKIPKGFPAPVYNFKNNQLSTTIFELGRKLFYDPILSKDSTISCASCHQPFAAFAHIDHALSHGINGKIGTRNVPALQNLIWNKTFMWDGGVTNLENQPLNPITHPAEMNETLAGVITKLQSSRQYQSGFKNAYNDTIISSAKILKALAQFTGLLISANSKYDRFAAGKEKFSEAEKNGLGLFNSKCANCHPAPLFTDNSYRNNGVAPDTFLNDIGRGKITQLASDDYTFKVPGLRNVELTFPYMHDGRYKRLRDVIEHYATPGKYNSNADKSLRKIGHLTDKEMKDIIAFLLTLTDKDFVTDKKFTDPHN